MEYSAKIATTNVDEEPKVNCPILGMHPCNKDCMWALMTKRYVNNKFMDTWVCSIAQLAANSGNIANVVKLLEQIKDIEKKKVK